MGKILRNLDVNLKNLSSVPYNPLDKKMTEIMRFEKNQREEDEITKKFQIYDKEVFQFRKESNEIAPLEENKLIFEKTSKLKNLNIFSKITIEKTNTNIEEKKEENIDASSKTPSLMKPSLTENQASSFQLGFNLFEVKNFDRRTHNNENVGESLINKPNPQNDYLKTSLQMTNYSKNQLHSEDSNRKKIHSHFRQMNFF